MIRTRPPLTALMVFLCHLLPLASALAQQPGPIQDLKEGPVTIQGTVKAVGTALTAPFSGASAVLVRTEARLADAGGTGHVGPKKGAKELATDFTVTDASGTVTVFVQSVKPGQAKWKTDVWDQELVRSGRKMTQDGQRAIRTLMGEPEAMGLFSSTGDVVVREAWVAPGQTVTVRGTYRKSPAPGIYATDSAPLIVDAPSSATAGGSGGVPFWAIGAGVAAAVGVLFFLLKR